MIENLDSQAVADARFANPERRVLDRAAEVLQQELLGLFDSFYDRVEDGFYDLADSAESDSQYAGYFLAMRLFRKHRQASRDAFLRALVQASVRFGRGRIGRRAPSASGGPVPTSVSTDQPEPEEGLAIANLVAKASSRHRDALSAIARQLASLVEEGELEDQGNPFGPEVIGTAFHAALGPFHEVDVPIKLVVYKLFDKHVMDRLERPYGQCLEILARAGSGDECEGRSGPRAAAYYGYDQEMPAAATHATQISPAISARSPPPAGSAVVTLAALEHLVEQRRALAPPARRGRTLETRELVAALCGLQRDPGPRPRRALSAAELCRQLASAAGSQAAQDLAPVALRKQDEATIELVCGLFRHILAGPVLPEPIKPLFARLQIPVVKVALLDSAFLDEPRHPARRLLNRMAQAAMGWNDDGDRSKASLPARLARTVHRVCADFDQDLSLLSDLEEGLAAHLARDAEIVKTWEHRVRQVAESRARASSNDHLADGVIRDRLNAYKNIPAPVVSLLKEGWSRVLSTAYQRGGQEGAAWRDAVAMTDRLLWSVQPKVTLEGRRELLRSIPVLLRRLRLALTDSSADPRQIASWFRDLQNLHLAALRGDGEMVAVSPSATETADGAPHAARRQPESPQVRLLDGTWILLRRDARERTRVKLLWQDQAGNRLVFVDRCGRKVLELFAEQLAGLMSKGLAIVVGHADDAVVDEAIAAISETIRG